MIICNFIYISDVVYGQTIVEYNDSLVGTLIKIAEDVEAKAEPNESSETLFILKKGEKIFLGKPTDNGWFSFGRDGKTAYFPANKIQEIESQEELIVEIQDQIEEQGKEATYVERYRKDAQRATVWGVVIVILIIAIFGVGIISVFKIKKNDGTDTAEEENSANEE